MIYALYFSKFLERNNLIKMAVLFHSGISAPTLNGTYFLSLDGATGVNNGHLRIMRNDDILCQSWLTESGHGDVGTCSVTAVLSAGDSVRVTGSAESPGRLQGEGAGFTGVMIRP